MKTKINTIDDYIHQFPKDIQRKLSELRDIIKKQAPAAQEKISYQMPAFFLHGVLVYFAAHTSHIGFYPTASGIKAFEGQLSKYHCSKGTIQLPFDQPLPIPLIKKIVKWKTDENMSKLKIKEKSQKG